MQKTRLYQHSADVDGLGNLAAASHRLGPHSTARLASTVLGYGHPSQSFRTPSAMSLASIEADGIGGKITPITGWCVRASRQRR